MQSDAKKMKIHADPRSGQAMLIAVLSLGGTILGATAIAGLLTLYQIRATTDTVNSARAIFAADSGVEWALFDFYCTSEARCPGVTPGTDYASTTFATGVSVAVNCYGSYDASGTPSLCSNASSVVAISTGASNDSARAFYLGIVGSTSSYP